MWWDIRKISEPTETMNLDPEKNGQLVGGTVLDFETTMVISIIQIFLNQKFKDVYFFLKK